MDSRLVRLLMLGLFFGAAALFTEQHFVRMMYAYTWACFGMWEAYNQSADWTQRKLLAYADAKRKEIDDR